MKQILLMEAVMGQRRLAVIEENALCELYYQRPGMENLTGNIYLGRVENVLPGMNAAFVDIGMEKNGFLSGGDIRVDAHSVQGLAERLKADRVDRLVRPGQEILTQVVKSQPGGKGPRLSCHMTLPGRTLVLLPDVGYVGISRKIGDIGERERLRGIGEALLRENGMGLILRTAAEGMEGAVIAREFDALRRLWAEIQIKTSCAIAPKLIWEDSSLVLRAVRDLLNADTERLWVDDPGLYREITACAEAFAPQWLDRIALHEGEMPLFDLYRVDDQAEKALRKYVWLKSGGSLVIEETEALTVIDVNTGKFTGKRSLEETICKTNCEAAKEIARQLRLRDLGGIIIVDFIDMRDEENQRKLLELLREQTSKDRTHVNVVGMTGLGLVELTRKKARQSLNRQLTHTCSDCDGNGRIASHETTARAILRDVWKRCRMGESNPILIEAAVPVTRWLHTLGAPQGEAVYTHVDNTLRDDHYSIMPADPARLPEGTKRLK